MILLVLGLLLLLPYAGLMAYYHRWWKAVPAFHPPQAPPQFLSVMVAARNEEAALPRLLDALRRQTYPADRFEVIVVDDHSTDGTAACVRAAALPNLRLVRPAVPASHSSKKKAIEAGVAEARGAWIVTTDADCAPPPRWLEEMNGFAAQTGARFLAAPVVFRCNDSLLQRFQALDFLTLQGITAASMAAGFPAMCNGANLAYRLDAFREVGGFAGIDRVATGDDMLLLHKIARRYPGQVAYLKSRDAIVPTEPMPTWRQFLMQRRRWASKTPVYQDRRVIALLVFVYLLNLWFPVCLIASLFHLRYLLMALAFLIAKTLTEFPFVRSVSRFYGLGRLLPFFPLFQPLHILYTVFIGLWSQWGKYEWKGRKTR